jgi:PEP-CTERM motif
MHYDLSQDTEFGGFQPDYLIPLDFNTNIIPQNSIIGISLSSPDDGNGGGGGGATPVSEPSTWALMLIGFAGIGFAGYRSRTTATA